MADVSGRTGATEPTPPDEVSGSKNRIFSSGGANRFKNRLSKSPKRRAGTPEPEQRTFTDESEKDISDGESLTKAEEKKHNSGIRRFFSRREKQDARSKSLEPKGKEPESEDDFETILQMHKAKEAEEERKASEKPKPKVKEELKDFVTKEMPPLIMAPKDNKKRKRHKSLPCQESQSEEEKPKTPTAKLKTRRKPSTSEEEELNSSRRGSEDLRNRKSVGRRIAKKMEKESESDNTSRDMEKQEEKKEEKKKTGFWRNWFKSKKEEAPRREKPQVEEKTPSTWSVLDAFGEWRAHVAEHRDYYDSCLRLRNRCISDLIILLMFCGCGGIVFRFTEGAFESFYKCGVKRVKRDFIDILWKSSQYMLEEDWKSQARRKLMEFENQLHSAHEAGMTTYSGQKSWSFLNSVVFCLSVVTTIGYGHISPSTTTGRAITIIYAIFGIPMFLILLADFGKLFTRGIKFLWAFVRRLYYTGSCRRVRRTAPVQEMMKGVQIMYDFAKSRRFTSVGLDPSQQQQQQQQQQQHPRPPDGNLQGMPETPIPITGTPNMSAFEIDDEFNLPISVAISILLVYIFFGAFLYWIWEEWSFFESFYFVFISMSTIGFGDFVPQHPMYMMLSIVYLIFGLALTSMCINVVQEKLSDTFRQASVKLGTTIGLSVVEEAGILPPQGMNLEPNNQPQ